MEQYNDMNAWGGFVQLPVCDKTVTTEISGEFTLPDYQPEIKRLLKVSASVLPASKYIGEREAEFAGGIDYYVLYTGSDNNVYCAPLSSEYKVSVPVENENQAGLSNMCAYASVSPDMISGRVTSPRKLNIKCRLRTRALIYGDMAIEDSYDAEGGELQKLEGEAEASRALMSNGDVLRLSDEMIYDSKEGDVRVISAEAKPLISETAVSPNAVNCRGELYLKLLLCRDDESVPYTVVRKLPFSQKVNSEGVESGASSFIKGSVSEMSINVEENRIITDCALILECTSYKPENISFIKDVYSTERECECEYNYPVLMREGVAFGGNFTLSDSMTLEEAGISSPVNVIDASGSVHPEENVFDGDRCASLGKVKLSLLVERDGEFSIEDIEFPYRYESNVYTNGRSEALYDGEVISARARVDGERIGVDAEICMRGMAWACEEEKMLDSVSLGDNISRSRGEIVICYPSKDDSIWGVAKRYAKPANELAAANKLKGSVSYDNKESLEGVKYLIV